MVQPHFWDMFRPKTAMRTRFDPRKNVSEDMVRPEIVVYQTAHEYLENRVLMLEESLEILPSSNIIFQYFAHFSFQLFQLFYTQTQERKGWEDWDNY